MNKCKLTECQGKPPCQACKAMYADITDNAFMKPGQQAMAVANALAKKWWSEGKLSYNWNPETDVEFLATVIQNNEVPNA